MTNPLHAQYYADACVHEVASVVSVTELARDTYRLRLASPGIAAKIRPGQFLMVRASGRNDPLLGRAFALYDVQTGSAGTPESVDVVFHVIGKMTAVMSAARPGDAFDLWGPLGNGFGWEPARHVVFVAGGIGQTPFLALAKELLGHQSYGDRHRTAGEPPRVTLCYGARSAEYLAGVEDFEQLGVDVRIATDDGSQGHHGFVTEVLDELLSADRAEARVECCGPEPMMEAVAGIAKRHQVPCRVSLETPMACGLGICFSCVTRVRMADGSWDYKRTCVDGPVFSAESIVW